MADALRSAARDGDLDKLRSCLDSPNGIDVDAHDSYGYTATLLAAQHEDPACLALLIERGADINEPEGSFEVVSPLQMVAYVGNVASLQLLIESGADLNGQDRFKNTALHSAANCALPACALMLMEAGSRRDVENVNGHTPADEAASIGNQETAAAIRYFVPARVRRRRATIRWRRAAEAKRDASLVFKAASEGRPMELARRLRLGKLAGGLEIEGAVKDGAGGTRVVGPLEAARLGDHEDCAELLKTAMG